MLESAEVTTWIAKFTRLLLRQMAIDGVPTTRDERWRMARRLRREVDAMRREAYAQTSAQLRAEGLQPAPFEPYRAQALVAAIERATGVEPPAQFQRPAEPQREASLERVEPQPDSQPERLADSQPERDRPQPEPVAERTNRTAEPRSRVRVSAPQQQPRSRVVVASADLDPQTRRQSRRAIEVNDSNREDPAVVRVVADRIAATVERHVRQVDRETVVATADKSGEEIGWARVLSGAENCAWCAMLASRGPVYKSDKSATTVVGRRGGRIRGTRQLGEKYHDHCDCDCVLVRKNQDWPGREEFERLQRMWAAASAAHPFDAERAFNRSWRRIKNHPELEDAYDELWASSTEGLTGGAALRAFAAAVKENPPVALEAARRPRRAKDDAGDSSTAA